MKLEDLSQGRTLVLGFGREGRALQRAVLARVPGARVDVLCDKAPDTAPDEWPLVIGAPRDVDFVPDRVLRSPGVPVNDPALLGWRNSGVEVTCISSLWFGERPEARVIAVTGSKGKSTTAALIAHMLAAEGNTAALGGNIGVPMLDLLETGCDWFVIELSSYQLADLQGHASIGVITRLFPEHQDWHGGAANYYSAKLRLVELLHGRALWINAGDPVLDQAVAGLPNVHRINVQGAIQVADDGIRSGGELLLPSAASPLPGRHNLDNIALAIAVVESAIGRRKAACASLSSFRALPHRLQPIAGPSASTWVNDSISTTPYATLAALQASSARPVLIVGGLERGADWSVVADYCRRHPLAGLVGLPDNGGEICRRLVAAGAVDPGCASEVADMQQAVAAAWQLSGTGGTVVLSPGAPSFPRFRDFEARGHAFTEAVRNLEG